MTSETKISISALVVRNINAIISGDKKNIFYLMYYSVLEAFLLMVSPLASAVIISSVLAHATLSITVLSFMVITIFIGITVLQILKQYIVEKFEQKIFVQQAIKMAESSVNLKENLVDKSLDQHMNYFFDVISIQKLFPILILNGSSLTVKLIVSLLLLLVFDMNLFFLGIFFIIFFLIAILFLGKNGMLFAIERSDAKHETIYFLQNIPEHKEEDKNIFQQLDHLLVRFVNARTRMFTVIIRQLSLTFFMEGLILSSFFILGGYLVFEGKMPIGEFVASEIIIISVTYALRDFMQQIDYIYDMVEGFYKIDKLSKKLESSHV